ncbi:Permease of the drug/metabolite transporter (DMT) superfamily [Marininema mesophilum]|uniref:Permease of the drug/metabolite transporter (DMT) superfamily n=1 Tax=Marininema mesophilum TaxID=1048340 RepID=A0A1H2PZF5_9BACL|nr:EamA family transporter [Marininema mesophilum]SDW00233.1 Permease of the drug/metabolite transporter (DMT) superfamily [Marininema mesophilum]
MKFRLFFILLCLVWGSTWLAIKIGVDHAPPLWSAGTRFFLAGVLLLCWYRWKHGSFRLEGKAFRHLFILGVLVIAVTFGLIYWGEQWVSSGLTAVLVQGLIPILMLLFSSLYRQSRLNAPLIGGIVLGLLGVFVIFMPQVQSPDNKMAILGMISIILGTTAYCWGAVISKDTLNQYSSILVSGLENLLGGAILMVVAPFVEWKEIISWEYVHQTFVISWLYLVIIGSIVGFTMFTYLLKEWGAIRVSLYSFFTPMVAILLGTLIYGERITWEQLLGSAMVLLGVWITNRYTSEKKRQQQPVQLQRE